MFAFASEEMPEQRSKPQTDSQNSPATEHWAQKRWSDASKYWQQMKSTFKQNTRQPNNMLINIWSTNYLSYNIASVPPGHRICVLSS